MKSYLGSFPPLLMCAFRSLAACSDTLLLRTFISALQLARDLRGGWLSGAPVVMLDAGPDLGYRRRDGLRYRECWGPAPHVIHPIDPTCNVASVSGCCWSICVAILAVADTPCGHVVCG